MVSQPMILPSIFNDIIVNEVIYILYPNYKCLTTK